jgi:hypothetical protein
MSAPRGIEDGQARRNLEDPWVGKLCRVAVVGDAHPLDAAEMTTDRVEEEPVIGALDCGVDSYVQADTRFVMEVDRRSAAATGTDDLGGRGLVTELFDAVKVTPSRASRTVLSRLVNGLLTAKSVP